MGSLRTINHPGYEQEEIDLSTYASTVGGTTSLVIGFAPQGQSGVAVSPTSKAAVKSYFGTPKTEAERYFYYACSEVFDKGGNLIAARIPYNNAAQNLTPAVKYKIEQWKLNHCNDYSPNGGSVVESYDSNYFSQAADEARTTTYFAFEDTSAEKIETDFPPVTGEIDLDGGSKITAIVAYTDASNLNRVVSVAHTNDAYVKLVINDADKITSVNDLTKANKIAGYFEYVTHGNPMITFINDVGQEEEIDGGVNVENLYTFTAEVYPTIAPKFVNEDEGAVFSSGVKLAEVWDDSSEIENYVEIPHSNSEYIQVIIFDEDRVRSPKDLTLANYNSNRFAYQRVFPADSVYTETPRTASEYFYVISKKQPVLELVKRRGSSESVIAIKSYFPSTGTEAETLPCNSNEYTEVRLTSEGLEKIKGAYGVNVVDELAPYLNKAKSTELPSVAEYLLNDEIGKISEFQIIYCKFTGSKGNNYTSLGNNFVAAPIATDVTNSTEYGDIGSRLAIRPTNGNVFNDSLYPAVEDTTLFGRSARVLSSLNGDSSEVDGWRNSGDEYGKSGKNTSVVYELVTDFASIKAIAVAGSQNYKWIRWEVPAVKKIEGENQNKALMGAILGCELDQVPSQIDRIENLTTIRAMEPANDFGFISLEDFQDYRDGAKSPDANTIVIANITEHQFGRDTINNDGAEILGIVPVLVGGMQALPLQSRMELPINCTNSKIINAVEQLVRGKSIEGGVDHVDVFRKEFADNCTAIPLGTEEYKKSDTSYSNNCIGYVPSINLNENYKPLGEAVNGVTLVVCQLAISKVENNKIVMTVLESFSGSLDSTSTDEAGVSNFIDNIVNSEDAGSSYVRMYTNYKPDFGYVKTETIDSDTVHYEGNLDNTAVITIPNSFEVKDWFAQKKNCMSLGFTTEQTKKYISYATITATLESVFDFLSNVDETEIDLVVDAGLSSIANRIKIQGDQDPENVKFEYDVFYDKIDSLDAIAGWKSICAKYLTFCSTTRKDCMAIIDAPRSLGVKNAVKLVREGGKQTIDFDVLPSLNYLAGLNSNYGAGYVTWMSYVDDFSGKTVWLPPSIAAEGSMILTDYKYNYWEAPAGKKRGVVTAAVDVAFNPNDRQQDSIYSKSWNYAIRNNTDGVLLWGQKTLTTTTSAFDRINVRRLFLRLERMTRKFLKEYLFEINNTRTRNQIVDGITPVYENVKTMGGVYDYRIYCSELNNTASVIDNNELRFAVGLKPSKVAEFIYASYVCLSTGMDFSEMEPVL